jgi:hypothetical protein
MAISQNAAGLVGGIYEADAASDALEELRRIGLAPEFDGRDYEGITYEGDFNPILYDDPEAAQYQTVAEDPRLKGIQMDALQKLIDQGSGAADMRMAADQGMALDEANQLARAREGAIRMDMERKGQAGSGMDSVLRAQSAQMGANRARQGTQQAVLDAALAKVTAQQGAIGAAGGIRGQDFNVARTNADIVNDFNKLNTAARNHARQANVGMKNAAGMRNLDTRQGIRNSNTGTRNASIDRKDRLAGAKHSATMDRWSAANDTNRRYNQGLSKAISGGVGMANDVLSATTAGMTGGKGGGGGGGGSGYEDWLMDPFDDEE